jgi:hypothetical protein
MAAGAPTSPGLLRVRSGSLPSPGPRTASRPATFRARPPPGGSHAKGPRRPQKRLRAPRRPRRWLGPSAGPHGAARGLHGPAGDAGTFRPVQRAEKGPPAAKTAAIRDAGGARSDVIKNTFNIPTRRRAFGRAIRARTWGRPTAEQLHSQARKSLPVGSQRTYRGQSLVSAGSATTSVPGSTQGRRAGFPSASLRGRRQGNLPRRPCRQPLRLPVSGGGLARRNGPP